MTFTDDSIKSYMKSISSIPLIKKADEIELAKLIEAGSDEAREKMIVSNLRLVVKIAHYFKSLGVPLSDLIAEGNIGLMKAVEKFRPDKGAKFSSYGAWWIKQSMRRAIADQSRVIRIPIQSAVKIKKIQKASLELAEKLGRIPTEAEIAEELEISEKTVHTLKGSANSNVVSLNAFFQVGEEGSLSDILPDLNSYTPEESLDEQEVRSYIRTVIDTKLKERERLILKLRYGIGGGQPKTLEEVSEIIGRTRERVRQIQHQALRKVALYMDEVEK
ncbi:MAG: RNA polymerase sigma factor RpoD/SigA [Lentisphaeraceae bacterium]|nr:RNA polymerase sigma factor RpoD/SigA [Lentisphaeraceae bacterium]